MSEGDCLEEFLRGKYLGKRIGDRQDEAEHFVRCRLAVAGSTAVILVKCSSRRSVATPGTGPTAMTGAQFEIRIDGTPRTYRDRKDFAMEAARLSQASRTAWSRSKT